MKSTVDLVLRGGRITTFADEAQGPAEAECIAIAGGRILAVGSDAHLAPLAALAERVIDLGGRRVIPGLNDSHIHAVRGGVSWTRTVHWEAVRRLADGLALIGHDARARGSGEWIGVIGGWHSRQLAEARPPTRAELDAAAPDNPVFVQELYDRGILNTLALRELGWDDSTPDPPGGRLMRDRAGALTGEIRGVGAFAVPTARIVSDAAEARSGTRAMFAEFARLGLTGVIDGGGLLMTPRDYDPLYALWRRDELDMRVRLFLSAWTRGGEVGDIEGLTSLVQPEVGDDMLRIAGVGEIPHLGCHDMEGFDPKDIASDSYDELVEIVRLCATRGWRMSVHAVLDRSLGRILDAWEQVEAETGLIGGRRYSIVHADEASERNLARLARLGAGVLVQSRFVLKGADYVSAWGEAATAEAPPLETMRRLGIPFAGGTDATRANWYSPWSAIWWLVTGRTIDGAGERSARHRLSRRDAISSYTRDSAWFTGEERHRGRLAPGYDADLCVPARDPFTCAVDDLPELTSDLTVVAGRISHAVEH